MSRIKGRTHVSTRPRATPLLKISLAPQGASTHVANSGGAAGWAGSAPILHFINLRETEAEREQPVALTQPQHRLEALDGPPGRVEGPGSSPPAAWAV